MKLIASSSIIILASSLFFANPANAWLFKGGSCADNPNSCAKAGTFKKRGARYCWGEAVGFSHQVRWAARDACFRKCKRGVKFGSAKRIKKPSGGYGTYKMIAKCK